MNAHTRIQRRMRRLKKRRETFELEIRKAEQELLGVIDAFLVQCSFCEKSNALSLWGFIGRNMKACIQCPDCQHFNPIKGHPYKTVLAYRFEKF